MQELAEWNQLLEVQPSLVQKLLDKYRELYANIESLLLSPVGLP